MIQISETATILLMLGFAMFLGLILTRAVRNFGIPAVTAYLVAGLLIGPSLIGRLGIGFRTFEDVEGAAAWRAYTSQGNRGFEGLGLGSYRDREIRVLVSGSEILRIVAKVSDSVVYKNIWISEAEEQQQLRQQYVAAIRGSIRSQLNQIDMQMEDGTIVNLGEKYGKKAGREG